jgi:AcrR family transcriptional regulator
MSPDVGGPTAAVTEQARGPGRRAAASREQVLEAATARYMRGDRVDVQSIATELGLGRTTIYRWFGTREKLVGEVLVRTAAERFERARSAARGSGAERILDTFDRFNRAIATAPPLRRLVARERETAVRIITAGGGSVQPRIVAMITAAIEEEVDAGRYDPPVEPATLGYAIVRLAEAFLFNDAATGMKARVERLREIEAALLGAVPASVARPD